MADTYTQHYNLTKPEPGVTGWDAKLNGAIDNIDAALFAHGSYVRQCAVSGMRSSGAPNYIVAGTSPMRVTVDATPTPLVMHFADGENDYRVTETVDQVVLVPDNTVDQHLYVDYDPVTNTLSYTVAAYTNRPVYGPAAPSSPAVNDMWFDTTLMRMYAWSGSAWVAVIRLELAHFYTSAGSFLNVETAAFNARRRIRVSVSGSTNYSYYHGLIEDIDNLRVALFGIYDHGTSNGETLYPFERIFATNGALEGIDHKTMYVHTYTTPTVIDRTGTRQTITTALLYAWRAW